MSDECVLVDRAIDIRARYVAANLHTRDSSIYNMYGMLQKEC